jgi:hypothetical protein
MDVDDAPAAVRCDVDREQTTDVLDHGAAALYSFCENDHKNWE